MKRMLINFLFLLLLFAGCSPTRSEPVPSLPGASQLAPTLEASELAEFRSEDKGIIIAYPDGWAVVDSTSFTYLAPDESLFPWKRSFSLAQPMYIINTMGPYVKRGNQQLNIPQPTIEVAQFIADTMDGELVKPVTSVDINGIDGASFLNESTFGHEYVVFLRIANKKVVVLSAHGPVDKSEEMQSVVNTIVLKTHLIED